MYSKQVNRFEQVNPDNEYRLLGVKWYAEGVFERERKLGKAIAAKQLNRVEEGDFIYNRLFAWKGSFAVVGNGHAGGHVSGEFPVFRAKPDLILAEFLYRHFCRPQVWKQIEHQSTGTTSVSRNRWKEEQFFAWHISLPPLREQERMVAILRAGDEAIRTNEEVIARTREFEKALAHKLLTCGLPGRHTRFKDSPVGRIPGEWEVKRLTEFAIIQTGLAKNKERHSKGSLQVPYLRVANVQDGYVNTDDLKRICVTHDEITRYALRAGDVLLTEGGDNDKLGRGCVWDGHISPCLHQNHVFVVRCQSEILPEFLALHTASPRGRRYFLSASKQTTNLASINSTQLKALPVPLPKLSEQHGICEAIGIVERHLRKNLDFLTELKESRPHLTNAVLSGQIRLEGKAE